MEKYYFLTLFLSFFALISEYNSLMVVLEKGNQYCINKDVLSGDILKGSFVCTGEHQKMADVVVNSSYSKILYQNKDTDGKTILDQGDFTINIEYSGAYSLCFMPKEDEIVVSFEFFTMNESGHIINLAKDGKYINNI